MYAPKIVFHISIHLPLNEIYCQTIILLILYSTDKNRLNASNSLFCAFIYTCTFQNLHKTICNFLLNNTLYIFCCNIIRIPPFIYPVSMNFYFLYIMNVFPSIIAFASISISFFSLEGSTASPITSINPIFSF